MGIKRISFEGKSNIGLYAKISEDYAVIPDNAPKKFEDAFLNESLKIIKTKISQSQFLGIYIVMNSNGMIIPNFCTKTEMEELKKIREKILILKDSRICAIANNIVCNDYGALLSPYVPDSQINKIARVLDVPIYKSKIKTYKAMGMIMVVTNRGFIVSNKITDEELKELKKIFEVDGIKTTVNLGMDAVGLGVIGNSKTVFVGEKTTGFELSRISQGLDII